MTSHTNRKNECLLYSILTTNMSALIKYEDDKGNDKTVQVQIPDESTHMAREGFTLKTLEELKEYKGTIIVDATELGYPNHTVMISKEYINELYEIKEMALKIFMSTRDAIKDVNLKKITKKGGKKLLDFNYDLGIYFCARALVFKSKIPIKIPMEGRPTDEFAFTGDELPSVLTMYKE